MGGNWIGYSVGCLSWWVNERNVDVVGWLKAGLGWVELNER